MNMSTPLPKLPVLQMIPENQNCNFLENGSNDFDYISEVYGNHLPK
jgi:hypothetical protein